MYYQITEPADCLAFIESHFSRDVMDSEIGILSHNTKPEVYLACEDPAIVDRLKERFELIELDKNPYPGKIASDRGYQFKGYEDYFTLG